MQNHPDIVIILEQILNADGLPIQIKSGIEGYISEPENIPSQENLVYHLVDLELIATDNEIIDDKPLYKIAILFLNKLINGENNTSKLSLFFLYLALCHLELGDHRSFLVTKNKLFALTEKEKPKLNEEQIIWLGLIHKAFRIYTRDNLDKAKDLFICLSYIDPFITEASEGDLYTCKEDFEHKLGNPDNSIPLGVGLLEKTRNETQTNYKNQRVLIFGREFFNSSTTKREHEVFKFLRNSLESIGANTIYISSENFNDNIPGEALRLLDKLAATVKEFRPTLVVFDEFGVHSPLPTNDFLSFIFQLREDFGVKLIGLYLDSWMPAQSHAIEKYGKFLDGIWEATSPSEILTDADFNYIRSPMPFDFSLYKNVQKTRQALFLGTVDTYNSNRAFYIHKLANSNLDITINITNSSKNERILDNAEYAQELCLSRVNVNFAGRPTGKRIITGRVWETLLARSVLLDEFNPEINFFLTPFRHYIPFQSFNDLKLCLTFLEGNYESCRDIAIQGRKHIDRYFTPEKIWSYVFRQVDLI